MWNRSEYLHMQHHQELIREAERERMALRVLRTGRPRSSVRFVRPAVLWFGRQLVNWGSALQDYYNPDPAQQEAY